MSTNDPNNHDCDARELLHIFTVVQAEKVRNHDVKGYAGMFSDDAIWCPNGGPERRGPPDIEVGVTAVLKGVNIEAVMTPVKYEVRDDFGYVFGHGNLSVTPQAGGPTNVYHSRELWVFRRVGGAWKIRHMIWNLEPSGS